jgi:hypothetical protein
MESRRWHSTVIFQMDSGGGGAIAAYYYVKGANVRVAARNVVRRAIREHGGEEDDWDVIYLSLDRDTPQDKAERKQKQAEFMAKRLRKAKP